MDIERYLYLWFGMNDNFSELMVKLFKGDLYDY